MSLAVFCWVQDRLFCALWTQFFEYHGYSYPQLHALWHCFVLAGSILHWFCIYLYLMDMDEEFFAQRR